MGNQIFLVAVDLRSCSKIEIKAENNVYIYIFSYLKRTENQYSLWKAKRKEVLALYVQTGALQIRISQ